jgi:hypothetical protein
MALFHSTITGSKWEDGNPTQFAVDIAILGQAIFDDKIIRLLWHGGAGYRELPNAEGDLILVELTDVLGIAKNAAGKLLVCQIAAGIEVGEVAIKKMRIALKHPALPLLADVYVENTQLAIGTDEDRVLLKQSSTKRTYSSSCSASLALPIWSGHMLINLSLLIAHDMLRINVV